MTHSTSKESSELRRELETARATIDASVRGEVDAVVDPIAGPTLLRTAQRALREREVELRAVFDGTLDAMLVADNDGRYVEANAAACAMLGVPRERLLGSTAADYAVAPTDPHELWRALLETGRLDGEFHVQRPNGERRLFEHRAIANILPGRHLCVLRDVTERRQTEQRLATVLDHAPIALFVLDREGRFTLVQGRVFEDRAHRMLGERAVDVLGALSVLHSDGTPTTTAELFARSLAGTATSSVVELASGWFELRTSPLRNAVGELDGVIGVAINITERRTAELELREKERMLRAVVDAAPVPIALLDRDAKVRLWNRAAEQICGWSEQEVLGHPVPNSDGLPYIEQVIANNTPEVRHGVRRPRKDGHVVDLSVWLSPLRDESGQSVGAIKILLDMTEQRQLEEQLQQAQKMESLGRLAGGIAHDFNNMLSAILGFASVLRDGCASSDPAREDLDQIVEAAERAARLTTQLLALGRRQMLAPTTVEVDRLIGELATILRRVIPESIELDVVHRSLPLKVNVDPAQLDQVLMNLVINARDAMPHGGSIRIVTSTLELDEREAERRPGLTAGRWACIAVQDTGVGMSEEVLSRAFDPFFTTKPKGRGTGLGLSTVYGIVKQSGGHVEARSTPGIGSTFEVYLPLLESDAATPQSTPARPTGLEGHETILLVEDEALVRRLIAQVLRQAGYEVCEASNSGEAMLLNEQHSQPIHLLLTDVVMPLMSGAELARRLLRARPNMKVLYISGHAADELGVEAARDLLPKPFSPRRLLEAVRAALDRPPG